MHKHETNCFDLQSASNKDGDCGARATLMFHQWGSWCLLSILADYTMRLAAQLEADKGPVLLDQYRLAGSVRPLFGRKKATLTVTKYLLYYKLIYVATTSL